MSPHAPPAFVVSDLAKRYGSTVALDRVACTVERATVHALAGGNGSGKSTLVKVLAGVVSADAGSMTLHGQPLLLDGHGASIAHAAGVRVVHQQNSIFPDLTIAENLAVGSPLPLRWPHRVDWGTIRSRARDLLDRFGIDADPTAPAASLTQSNRVLLAIARALGDVDDSSGGLLVLDEPTASLPPREVGFLLDTIRNLAGAGNTVVYISHRLDEVQEVASAATVLVDGRVGASLVGDEVTASRIVSEMLAGAPGAQSRSTSRGATVAPPQPGRSSASPAAPIAEIRGVGPGQDALVLHEGEVVGLLGLLGSGRTAILERISGVRRDPSIEITLQDNDLRGRDLACRLEMGIALVPSDRARDAMFADLSIARNLSIARLRDFARWGRVSARSESRNAINAIDDCGVKASSPDAPMASLSGGNQQKVILARAFGTRPSLLLLDEPTQGVDVSARAEIHRMVREHVDGRAAVIVVASDIRELAELADRCCLVDRSTVTTIIELDRNDPEGSYQAMVGLMKTANAA